MFKGIPYQVKLNDGGEHRRELPVRFTKAVEEATLPEDNIIFDRKWETLSTRYGTPDEVFSEVIEELEALYPEAVLRDLVEEAKNRVQPAPMKYFKVSLDEFKNTEDWKERLYMLNHFDTPDESDYPLLEYALSDEKMQVRRMSVSLLAMIEVPETLKFLKIAMADRAIPVRRTAADAYSDLGFKEGLPDMYEALGDKSPIVRWRAAMFIYETGDEDSLGVLKAHQHDPQYDVRLQIEMAIARIEEGEEALGSVWKQMQNRER